MSLLSPARARHRTRTFAARASVRPAAAVVLLAATALIPFLPQPRRLLDGLALATALLAALIWVVLRGAARLPNGGRRAATGGAVHRATEMALHLSPVALLTFVFPLAVARMGDAQIGGVELPGVLLASSLTVPWLSMAVCLPLYRAIGALMASGDVPGMRARFVRVWPVTLVQSLPVIAVFVVVVQAVMRWSWTALAAYTVLCVLHVVFAQSLVIANAERDRRLWATAWAAYALTLLVVPLAWFLPPVVATVTQVVALRREISQVRGLDRLDPRDVAMDLGRGLLLGSVLWSHLFFFYLAASGTFAVVTIFIAVLPAVLAYNYYFVRLAPRFDDGVLALRSAMEREPHAALTVHSSRLAGTVVTSLTRTAFAGALIGFVVTAAIATFTDLSATLVASVAVASWLFLMTTVACYKLDYVGRIAEAQLFSAAQLLSVVVVFLLVPPGPEAYAWLIAVDAVIFVGALRRCLTHWQSSEYALFWRHATAW